MGARSLPLQDWGSQGALVGVRLHSENFQSKGKEMFGQAAKGYNQSTCSPVWVTQDSEQRFLQPLLYLSEIKQKEGKSLH